MIRDAAFFTSPIRQAPAYAIIAPLSVHNAGRG
jgi:hypothetical protein